MHSSAIGTHYTSLISSCPLPKIHCQTSFICTVTDELSEVSPSILVFAAYQLLAHHAQPTIHPTNPALFEPSPISSPTDEMQTLTGRRGGFISPTSKSSFHVALLTERLYMQKIPSFPAASIETSSPPFVRCVAVLLCSEAALLSLSRNACSCSTNLRACQNPRPRPPPRPVDNIAHKKARNVVKHSNARFL